MPKRSHSFRRPEDFLKSDSDDDDYDDAHVRSSPKKVRSARPKKSKSQPSRKRQRRDDYGSDGVVDDSDDHEEGSFDEDSIEESSGSEDEEDSPGPSKRKQRKAVRTRRTYVESDEDAEGSDDAIAHLPEPVASPKKFIIRLSIPSEKLEILKATGNMSNPRRSTRANSARVSVRGMSATPAEGLGMATRRSSRASQDQLVALSDSGRHTQAQGARQTSFTPDPQLQSARSTRSRGLKKPPPTVSAIMEVSQEEIPASQEYGEVPESFDRQLREFAEPKEEEGEEPQAGAASPFVSDVQMEVEQEPAGDEADAEGDEEDDDDEGPINKNKRKLRSQQKTESPPQRGREGRRLRPRTRKSQGEASSDFEPPAGSGGEEASSADELQVSPKKNQKSDNDSSSGGGRLRRSRRTATKRSRESSEEEHLDPDEIADEADDLREDRRRNKRPRRNKHHDISFEPTTLRNRSNRPDYRIFRPEIHQADEEEADAPPTSQRPRRGAAGPWRSLFSTMGPFGGAGGPVPIFGGEGAEAAGGADSDSSDDDMAQKMPRGIGGAVGMTPTAGTAPGLFPQTHNADAGASTAGGLSNFGKVKDKKALADADPLGVDPNVNFDGVGGLEDHIDRLKEMVQLPLMYPEIFQTFKVTPPRGVLFHGPPGTGKTLLARALASSISTNGKKVTFYMRKGADALSKWVGEAERQLRLLFEEARKTQPSIIFFDEIDGLAPVRSSKQEQIHASIVATLLALMDGMDGRGQVIVIGATNRPDSVDPALRRPGRFDREFYFPLPNVKARRAILDIHTKGWEPPLKPEFKDQLAALTRGYGGADLRSLCTEAALNAVQGTFPQIYSSNKKLLIDPSQIRVKAKDFMISVNKIVPSSERSAASGASALKPNIEPLLRDALAKVSALIDEIIPQKKPTTALEEAMFDDRDDENGFEKENLQREFESSRINRPRLLISGLEGMGQSYISGALLAKFEGLHVQSFDMSTLLKDSTRSPEAAVVQLFEEVKRHKPSVIYLPSIDIWYETMGQQVIKTFNGLLRTLSPTDPVLVLGVMELRSNQASPNQEMMRELFSRSRKNYFLLDRPGETARREFFVKAMKYIQQSPAEFPQPENRKRRILPVLPEAPVVEEEAKPPSKAELKAQKKKDRFTLNNLKLLIQPVMDQIKLKYKKFRAPIIDPALIGYLYDEQDPSVFTTDLDHTEVQQLRPYEIAKDSKGTALLHESATGKQYYNLEIVTIEKRLSNGYYKRPKDFLNDVRALAKDAKTSGDQDRTLKANEMLANVEVDMMNLEAINPVLVAECEAVYNRELAREKEQVDKAGQAQEEGYEVPIIRPNVPPNVSNTVTDQSTGPVHLGEDVPGPRMLQPFTPGRPLGPSPLSNGLTNGSSVPSRVQEEPEMPDSQENSLMNLQGRAGFVQPYATPSAQGTQPYHTHTQTSALTRLAPGSGHQDYYNSASSTSSGHKTSNQSHRSSAPFSVITNTSSNGVRNDDAPDFSALPQVEGGSQLPNTQPPDMFSSQQSQSSQRAMGPPPPSSQPHHSFTVQALLNEPQLIQADPAMLKSLDDQMVRKSSGLNVEQLEQVMASIMDAIWRTKGDYNRNHAASAVSDTFNETIRDIEECQAILAPSQDE
ncbi:AAA-domain-containing protein [Aureobasidium pullulans]|uniref:AAA-domain-containing protein n=1 Tax=Aureobasidium pullulans TaxID=5580 RepID=A0A4S9BTT3_AURPU|nr:AAA-domain-containing protein [Aureobasidium pullulans]